MTKVTSTSDSSTSLKISSANNSCAHPLLHLLTSGTCTGYSTYHIRYQVGHNRTAALLLTFESYQNIAGCRLRLAGEITPHGGRGGAAAVAAQQQ